MRILIADDSREAASALGRLLEGWGFEPIVVHDGLAALTALRDANAPTLALLDWMMPGMNGIDVCRQLRKNLSQRYTYVLLVTGQDGADNMIDGLNAGADDYLVKPVNPAELRARLSTARRILGLQEQLLASYRLLHEQATRDSLTGLWNRKMILEILDRELARGRRDGQHISIVMADIDHFKNINDTHGHLVGDQVLRQTAERLRTLLRPYDTLGRYGGEEFLLVLAGCDTEVSMALADRLRRCLEAEPALDAGQSIVATLSLGVATWDGENSANELLHQADDALYQAKRAGRNRVVAATTTNGHALS